MLTFSALVLAVWSSGFLAATLLPGGSEAVFVWALAELDKLPVFAQYPYQLISFLPATPANSTYAFELLLHISLANTFGAMVTFLMGYWGIKLLPVSDKKVNKSAQFAVSTFKRYGVWSLLLAWLPLIGDVLCLAAGAARLPVFASVVLIFIGKLARYTLILWFFISSTA